MFGSLANAGRSHCSKTNVAADVRCGMPQPLKEDRWDYGDTHDGRSSPLRMSDLMVSDVMI